MVLILATEFSISRSLLTKSVNQEIKNNMLISVNFMLLNLGIQFLQGSHQVDHKTIGCDGTETFKLWFTKTKSSRFSSHLGQAISQLFHFSVTKTNMKNLKILTLSSLASV